MPPLGDLLRALPVFAVDLPDFDAERAPVGPVPLFTTWLLAAVAAGVPEPHAMTLATVDGAGRPSTRLLICKDVDVRTDRHPRTRRARLDAPAAADVEFWQADRDRRHVRLRYTRDDDGWRRDRLWP